MNTNRNKRFDPPRFDHIVGFSTDSGHKLAFHSENMQIAELDNEAWAALTLPGMAASSALQEINEWNNEIDPNVKDLQEEQELRYLSINVAQLCNLRCTYCAAGGDGTFGEPVRQIDLAKVQSLLQRFLTPLPAGSTFTLNFLGGEPLLAPSAIFSIIAEAKKITEGKSIDFVYRVVTNATLITAKVADRLAEHRFHVQVSLDGPPEINDVTRPTAGGQNAKISSTTLALRGITELFARKEKMGSVSVNSVHGNHHSDAMKTYLYLRDFAWDRISLSFDTAGGSLEANQAFTDSLCAVGELAFSTGGERELRRILDFDAYFSLLEQKKRNRNFCGAGKSQLALDAKGRAFACYWWANQAQKSEEIATDPVQMQKALAQYAQDQVDAHGCGACWAKNICGGGCMQINLLKNGDKRKKDLAFCDRTRQVIGKGVELYARARNGIAI